MHILETSSIYSAKGYPLYTRQLRDLSKIYIKNGEVLKNRGKDLDDYIDIQNEMESFNNIIIEENGIVNIYCKQDKRERYQQVIDFLKERYSWDIDNKILINCL